MATRMLQRRGTAAEAASANPILGDGEVGWERDTGVVKIGDGVLHWADLPEYRTKAYNDANYLDRKIINAQGDLLVGTEDDTAGRLPKGAVGQRLTIDGAGNLVWADLPPAANPFVGIDAAGDLLVGTAPDTVGRLPIGANGKVLGVAGGLPAWVTPAAADLSSVVAKAGDTMTGPLKMSSAQAIRWRTGAADANNDVLVTPVVDATKVAAGAVARFLNGDGSKATIDGGPVYDNNNRVYSASNPPPVSGMTVLAVVNQQAVNFASASMTSFTAPPSGRVVVHGMMPTSGNGKLYVSLDNSTFRTVAGYNYFNPNGYYTPLSNGDVAFGGLTPGAGYTLYGKADADGTQAQFFVEG